MLMGFFAAFYDSVLWLGERSGMQERRRRLLACVGRQPSAEDIHRRAEWSAWRSPTRVIRVGEVDATGILRS